jgi:hypothetical protein
VTLQSFKNTKGLIILLSSIAILLFYTLDFNSLSYRVKDWETFAEMPVAAGRIQYFVADTPLLIGYTDPLSRTSISCATTVAYVETGSGDTYRCCDTGNGISCLGGDFSNEIPAVDETCTEQLRQAFSVPAIQEGAADYRLYGSCADSPAPRLTIVQLDTQGQILWKFLDSEKVLLLIGTLRCVLAPLLLALIIGIVILTARAVPKEPIPRF